MGGGTPRALARLLGGDDPPRRPAACHAGLGRLAGWRRLVQLEPWIPQGRNLAANLNCAITTDNAYEPVIIEGAAVLIADLSAVARFVAATNQKYGTDYAVDFFNPASNACFQVRPTWAFGLTESDFTGSPTRWLFPPMTD